MILSVNMLQGQHNLSKFTHAGSMSLPFVCIHYSNIIYSISMIMTLSLSLDVKMALMPIVNENLSLLYKQILLNLSDLTICSVFSYVCSGYLRVKTRNHILYSCRASLLCVSTCVIKHSVQSKSLMYMREHIQVRNHTNVSSAIKPL